MTAQTASVEVLTAEVRTLMIGSRQVTLSVAKQLDWMIRRGPRDRNRQPWFGGTLFHPFGRVALAPPPGWEMTAARGAPGDGVALIGRRSDDGALVRAWWPDPGLSPEPGSWPGFDDRCALLNAMTVDDRDALWREQYRTVLDLPLIVLAGLR